MSGPDDHEVTAFTVEAEIWVFHGSGGRFACAVFTSLDAARRKIAEHELSGLLTRYPPDQLIWEWVQEHSRWRPKSDVQSGAEFKQGFSSAYTGHFHFEDGVQMG